MRVYKDKDWVSVTRDLVRVLWCGVTMETPGPGTATSTHSHTAIRVIRVPQAVAL